MSAKTVRAHVLGVPVDCTDFDGVLATVDRMINGDRPGAVLAVNPEKVIAARRNPDLLRALVAADLLIPDGIGVVMAMRLNGLRRAVRVPGSEVMPALCAHAAHRGYKVFFFGGQADVLDAAATAMRDRHPDLIIAGSHHGYVSDAEMPAVIRTINESRAQILFIALGSPKQEKWIDAYMGQLTTVRVCQGVGGTFDVLAGRVKRAPAMFRRLNLEWFYRLVSQPTRAARQAALPVFAWRVLVQRLAGSGRGP